MTLHHILLIIHLIAATIWIGGHLTLSIVFLPVALRKKEPLIILNFEKKFEPLGISSLIALIIQEFGWPMILELRTNHGFIFPAV